MSPASVRLAVSRAEEVRLRRAALRGAALNSALILVLAYDLSCKCPGYMSGLHYVELALAACSCASLARHLLTLLPGHKHKDTSLCSPPPSSPPPPARSEELPLSPRPHSTPPHCSPTHSTPPHSPLRPLTMYEPREDLIADKHSLDTYLKEYEQRYSASPVLDCSMSLSPPRSAYSPAVEAVGGAVGGGALGAGGAPATGGASPHRPAAHSPQLPRHLLDQYTLNIRLWIHVTILERLVRQMDELDQTFVKLGLSNYKLGEVSVERLAGLCSGSWGALAGLGALLELLQTWPEQRLVVQRLRELSVGGCLRQYRWNQRPPGAPAGAPSDAELVLALFAWYLDVELAPPPRRFSSQHLCLRGAIPPAQPLGGATPAQQPGGATPAAQQLLIMKTSSAGADPHYVLVDGNQVVDPGPGRQNLLSVLALLVLAASGAPCALQRAPLGGAGLNLLWTVGRE